jgi:uncharacterized protein YuzE
MKLHFHPGTDSLYIELKSQPDMEVRKVADSLIVDLEQAAEVPGFGVDRASTRLELTTLATTSLSFNAIKAT